MAYSEQLGRVAGWDFERGCHRRDESLCRIDRTHKNAAALLALLQAALLDELTRAYDDELPAVAGEDEPQPLVSRLVDDLVTAPHAPTRVRVAPVAA